MSSVAAAGAMSQRFRNVSRRAVIGGVSCGRVVLVVGGDGRSGGASATSGGGTGGAGGGRMGGALLERLVGVSVLNAGSKRRATRGVGLGGKAAAALLVTVGKMSLWRARATCCCCGIGGGCPLLVPS